MWNFYDSVNKEDIDVCQLVQEGVASGPCTFVAGGCCTLSLAPWPPEQQPRFLPSCLCAA